jgi:hypothetical protein
MDLRLRNLEQLDARAVPLPHGTEVTTRVERIVGERRVPQGAVGRVTKADGDEVEVTIVGVGVLRYARSEVAPRRVGQALFAHRRADAWEALRPCVVLDTVVGSRAWGLADADSDVDHRGVFALPRFAQSKSADFDLPRELRPKNAYNLVRLLATATRWLREGAPTFEVEADLRARLLAIKKGDVSLADVLAQAEAMGPELERARDESRLPKRPDVVRADALLRRVGCELARRWATGEPGPLGKDAPPPPEVAWSE